MKFVDTDTPAPTDPAALAFLTMTTKPSFRAVTDDEFKADDGGTAAVYMARWINTRGEKGPRSEIMCLATLSAGATVAAYAMQNRSLLSSVVSASASSCFMMRNPRPL